MKKSDRVVGLLLVDKPEGPTSHDVVQQVRQVFCVRRIGHTGTLDPFASGLLLLCVGPATRLTEYFHRLPKRYEARVTLGTRMDTDDHTGRVVSRSAGWKQLSRGDVERSAARLEGLQEQLPPDYSAKKIGGRRAYEAARAGERLSLVTAPVEVHALRLTGFSPPDVELAVEASTGTYVRSLARDLGEDLGCHAHLSALRRTGIGSFEVTDAIGLDEIGRTDLPDDAWLSPLRALEWLPSRRLTADELRRISHGQSIPQSESDRRLEDPVVLTFEERLVAIGRSGPGGLHPVKVLGGTG
jgi:tRNA pseudouridine55 synthase